MNSEMPISVLERTRPGIHFEVAAPPTPEALPRMEVAAFIGFAERGPLHCPVAIEDMSQFKKVFGETPKLGWAENGEQISGVLAECVNSFFVQGGRRCWVVRVAGSNASSNQYMLPNLFKVTSASGAFQVLPATAQARCEGSWSDTLRVATRIQTRPIALEKLSAIEPGNSWEIRTFSDIARAGDLLRIDLTTTSQAEGKIRQAFFPIGSVERNKITGEVILTAHAGIAFQNTQGMPTAIGDPAAWLNGKASLVSVDLSVRDEPSSEWRATNLGLTPQHVRYCGALPTDLEVYRTDASQNGSSVPLSAGASVDSGPWFPLAAKAADKDTESRSFMVPLGMNGSFGREDKSLPNAASKLVRDGLSNFDASLFLDPALHNARIADLIETADAIRYSAPVPRPLSGMHVVLGWFNTRIQEEVTLIAIPDAIHTPWLTQPQAQRYAFTSNDILPREDAVISQSFVCCQQLAAPSKFTASSANQTDMTVNLTWEMPESLSNIVLEYQVQESANEDFLLVEQTWQTGEKIQSVVLTAPGRRIFRVRATTATQISAWSAAIALNIVETETGVRQSSMDGAVTREIQRELIKLCVAQGEMFAVLSLPKKITALAATNHVQSLSLSSFNDASASSVYFDPEGRVGSYAALYHPWVESRISTGSVKPLPPDGAILGMIASRTHDRGAWIAPANRVLKGVVALHTTLPEVQKTQLTEAGINLVLQRPEGYTLLSEETLSNAADLRPIHVRRLLILMRRIMLRLGEEFTFETNNLTLRALIRQRCYNMLERMYRAGAFAGRSAAESFQVSIEDTDNPQTSIDAGRLIIRIRIRPAQALRFITIRFALGGGATGITEESAA